MMPEMTDWQLYLRTSKTEAHRNWLERGKVGEGRINLENKNLTRAVFSGADLADSRFVRCDWSNSNISGDFAEAEISECIWNNSLLYGVHFDRALIERCNFADAYLGITHFIEAKIKGGDWSRSDLDKSTWTDAVVENACFQRVNFSEARFHGSRFVNCDLRNTNLESATLRSAVFENCDFRGAYLYDFVFEKVTFINCGFHNCTGIPAFEGEYTFIQPDLSEAFDGTGIIEQEKLLEQWKSQSPLSIPETLHPPQWLNYISRENEDDQVDWVSAGMKGSPPMDLKSEDLSKAFAYQAYFRAARFTNSDFTGSDLRRSQVQQAEFVGCKFDDALLMYLEGGQETALDVKTTKVIFADCTAKGAYFNRSELWIAEFVGGNWDGSYFNNCVWTLTEFENVSFENTDWRGAKLDSVKFVNCSFRKAIFHKANIRAAEFINCDFRNTNFGFVDADKVAMKQCAFYGATGMVFDIEPLKEDEMRILDADFSSNFDGSLVFEPIMRAQDLFNRIGDLPSHEVSPSEINKITNFDESNQVEKSPTDTKDTSEQSTPVTQPNQPEETEEQRLAKLQAELKEDKEQLTYWQAQLKKVEAEIENARRTNIWGRPQSGKSEAERDRLVQEIADIQDKMTRKIAFIKQTKI